MTYHGRILLSDLFGSFWGLLCFVYFLFWSSHHWEYHGGITVTGRCDLRPGVPWCSHQDSGNLWIFIHSHMYIYIEKKHETSIKPLSYRQYQPIQRPWTSRTNWNNCKNQLMKVRAWSQVHVTDKPCSQEMHNPFYYIYIVCIWSLYIYCVYIYICI